MQAFYGQGKHRLAPRLRPMPPLTKKLRDSTTAKETMSMLCKLGRQSFCHLSTTVAVAVAVTVTVLPIFVFARAVRLLAL